MKVNKLVSLAVIRTQLGDPKDFSFVSASVDGALSWLDGNMTLAQLKPNNRVSTFHSKTKLKNLLTPIGR